MMEKNKNKFNNLKQKDKSMLILKNVTGLDEGKEVIDINRAEMVKEFISNYQEDLSNDSVDFYFIETSIFYDIEENLTKEFFVNLMTWIVNDIKLVKFGCLKFVETGVLINGTVQEIRLEIIIAVQKISSINLVPRLADYFLYNLDIHTFFNKVNKVKTIKEFSGEKNEFFFFPVTSATQKLEFLMPECTTEDRRIYFLEEMLKINLYNYESTRVHPAINLIKIWFHETGLSFEKNKVFCYKKKKETLEFYLEELESVLPKIREFFIENYAIHVLDTELLFSLQFQSKEILEIVTKMPNVLKAHI